MATSGAGLSTLTLALRGPHSKQPQCEEMVNLGSEGENLGIRSSKRRTSQVKWADNAASDSDSDYEVVAGPAPVEFLGSDSDSDADRPVIVDHPANGIGLRRTLPIRNGGSSSSLTLVSPNPADTVDSGSESDWTLV